VKVLLIGASGFVGGHLAPALLQGGHDVVCAVRDPSSYAAPDGAEVVRLDLSRPLDPEALPHGDAVAHFAQANVRFPDGALELERVNAGSVLELLDHARRTGAARFVYASSGSVYGFGDRPFREDDPLGGNDFYATTKLNAERFVRAYDDVLATAILRLVVPYGPGQQGRMIPALIDRVQQERPVTLNGGGKPVMNPLYVGDVCRAVLGVLELDESVVLNVAGDEPASVRELAETIGTVVGREPVFEAGSTAAPGDLVADNSRLHDLLDLRPLVPLAEGLRRTVEAHTVTAAG
jgi:nucleoside-diphosphate-sugar epimerase